MKITVVAVVVVVVAKAAKANVILNHAGVDPKRNEIKHNRELKRRR